MKIKREKFSTPRAAKALQTRIRNANSGKSDPLHPLHSTRLTKKPKAATDEEFRILVCGSRDWKQDSEGVGVIRRELLKAIGEHQPNLNYVLVITGSTEEEDNGVDSIVDALCRKELGVACAIFRAPWEQFRRDFGNPRPAGPKRNGWMLRWGRPNLILAFHPYIVNSRGTKNMCEQARQQGVAVRVIQK